MLFIHEHDPQFLHRDLTAKNVLMNKDGCVMNISDRPWSDKFRPSSVLHLTTKAPRCIRYMLPECLVDGPHFTDKRDVFSFGVVALQVSAQEPPSSGLRGIGVQKEVERWAADLANYLPDHTMQPLFLQCLQDNSAQQLKCTGMILNLLASSSPNYTEAAAVSCAVP